MKILFDFLDELEFLPRKVVIALCTLVFVIIVLFCVVSYLSTVVYYQNKYAEWVNYRLNKLLEDSYNDDKNTVFDPFDIDNPDKIARPEYRGSR